MGAGIMELMFRGCIEKIEPNSTYCLYLVKSGGRTYEIRVSNSYRNIKEPFKKGDVVDLWKKPDFVNFSFLMLKTNRVRKESYYK